ncbi:ribosomal protein S18-alanine N-acetyltransferase [Saxibacter everestensis]|uniref:Ribosomal protein S18-alanine N-acetyltransferase n=1 Tax=Saxibacter everestensis TaxID=2909229 RepID=A0ABY8QV51_9MICO|nr:ribosomal protein S18-alanine N-acetyltransferase [Brevibacteriaceae bacterium ZFBP1038]
MSGEATTPDGPIIVPLRWWHLPEAAALDARLFRETSWTQETFWAELAAPQREYSAVLDGNDRLLGYAGLAWSAAEADVQTVAVSTELQGNGIGRQLMLRLIEQAGNHGATSLLLEVRADNEPAKHLYTKLGFDRIAVRRGYYQPGNIDAHIMRLRPLHSRN